MASDSVNVADLSDAELASLLRQHGVSFGPIIRMFVCHFRKSSTPCLSK